MSTVEVKPGQVWADNDPRTPGRTIRVEKVEGDRATCTVLTPATNSHLDSTGRTTTVALSRFRPTRTGYKLISDNV